MEKLSIDETWRRCMDMWQFIAEQLKNGSEESSGVLKERWLRSYYPDDDLKYDCYFCEAAKKISFEDHKCMCIGCPAREIDPTFDCDNGDNSWHLNGIGFYNTLCDLNQKRLRLKTLETENDERNKIMLHEDKKMKQAILENIIAKGKAAEKELKELKELNVYKLRHGDYGITEDGDFRIVIKYDGEEGDEYLIGGSDYCCNNKREPNVSPLTILYGNIVDDWKNERLGK